jgi:outer membrane lipoprotein-sorting protein
VRTSFGLAAAIVIAAMLVTFLAPPKATFGQVLQKIEQTKTLVCDVPEEGFHAAARGDLSRLELADGKVSLNNRKSGELLVLDPKNKTAQRSVGAPNTFDLYSWFKDFKDGKEERIGEKKIGTHDVVGFKITRRMGPDQNSDVTLTIWVDRTSTLPVEASGKLNGHNVTFTDFHWDEPLDDKLFDMGIPSGYKVTDLGGVPADQLKPSPTAQEANSLILKPGVGIGNLKFGDNADTVTKILGKPEAIANEAFWEYPSKGLSVTIAPGTDLGVLMITASSKKAGNVANIHDFAGQTDKGIVIGSTRAQVEAAYGKADKIDNADPDLSTLSYEKPFIGHFTLRSDKVVEIRLLAPPRAFRVSATASSQPSVPSTGSQP